MTKPYVYMLIYLTFSLFVNNGTVAYAAPTKYSEKGCDFAVLFPDNLSVSKVSAGSVEAHEAELRMRLSLLRATCLPGPNRFADEPNLLKEAINQYFLTNGMVNTSVKIDDTNYGKRAEGRGFKKIKGLWATYVTVWCVTQTSVLTLTAATLSEQYPSDEISAFINSVEIP